MKQFLESKYGVILDLQGQIENVKRSRETYESMLTVSRKKKRKLKRSWKSRNPPGTGREDKMYFHNRGMRNKRHDHAHSCS